MITNDLEVTVAARGAAVAEPDLAIRVRGLRKSYDGAVHALDGIDLDVRRGEVLAVLGPNGAGKTTLVEILEGHRIADAGEASVLGHDPARRERAFRARIGIVLQETGIDSSLSVREAVDLYSAAYPHPRPAAEVLDVVGLGDHPDVRVSALSGGQRRRLDLALGIAGDPELVFLDEPTTGFDPSARRHSWELISALRDLGKTILLTTHYMDEAQNLADRVVVIARGRVIAEGTRMTLPARSDLNLLASWLRARVRIQLRTGRAVAFTFAFPLVLLVLFNGLNGNATVDAVGAAGQVKFAQFYTPSIGIFSLTTACYTSVIIGIATARDSGLLKRVKGTPLPMSIHLGSWLTGAALTGIAAVVLLFAVAVPVFGVHIYMSTLPAAIVTLALGAACLASVGLAVATLAKTADQATPIAQLTFLPVSFISGIWFPLEGAPHWLTSIAKVFPLEHIVHAFDRTFSPGVSGGGWSPDDLWSIVVWTAIALFVATRRFSAEPGAPDQGSRRGVRRRTLAGG